MARRVRTTEEVEEIKIREKIKFSLVRQQINLNREIGRGGCPTARGKVYITSIFEKDGWLWAEEVRVEYFGEDEGTEIRMDDQPPREAPGAREISPARQRSGSLRARTFARLKALSGWGD